MTKTSSKAKLTTLEVNVILEELTDDQGWPNVAAYVFSRSGRLLAKQPLEPDAAKPTAGQAVLELEAEREDVVVKIGPDVEDVGRLKRYHPAVDKVLITPEKKAVLSFEIVKSAWWCWLKLPYVVTGTVEKQTDGYKVPICTGEVDIYDVDIGYCFLRLPNLVIERIRDSIIDVVVDPPPFELAEIPRRVHWDDNNWCGTGPKPPFPPVHVDIIKKLETLPPEWAFAKQRFEALSTARTRMTTAMQEMTPVEKRAWLNTEAVAGVQVSQLLYSNTAQFRGLLLEHFQAFRFWLCWYPWIYWLWWPYCWWYSLEKLGTAKLQPDGSFSKTVWLSICRHDTPDLWFVVRQKINGVERVIYARHPVPCNTYWNHPSGKPVHLVVTDPNAVVCYQDPETGEDPADLWVAPLAIGNYSLKRVYGTGAGSLPADNAKIGLYEAISTHLSGSLATFNDGPFGGRLGLRILFAPALESAGVKYYRIKYRSNGTGDWSPLTDKVVRHYVDGSSYIKVYPLGPQPVGTEDTLFEIPPGNPLSPPQPIAMWVVHNATVDLINGYLDSTGISNGYVEFKLELFDAAGNRVDPATFMTSGIAFKLPGNNNVMGNIPLVDASTVNSALVQSDPEDPTFQAFIFRLQIDNRKPKAAIDEPHVNPSGNVAGPCGMLRYNPPPTAPGDPPMDTSVTMTYQARHQRKFAQYRFRLYRGKTHLHTEEGQAGDYGLSGSFTVAPGASQIVSLLGGCLEAAFSENLSVWNMAFNGWSRVGPDASAVRAFALALPRP
jgi:hypothetical protein